MYFTAVLQCDCTENRQFSCKKKVFKGSRLCTISSDVAEFTKPIILQVQLHARTHI